MSLYAHCFLCGVSGLTAPTQDPFILISTGGGFGSIWISTSGGVFDGTGVIPWNPNAGGLFGTFVESPDNPLSVLFGSETAEAVLGIIDIAVASAERIAKRSGNEKLTKVLRRIGQGLGAVGIVFDFVDLFSAETPEQRIAAVVGIAVGAAVIASGGAPILLVAEGVVLILDASNHDERIIREILDVFDPPSMPSEAAEP